MSGHSKWATIHRQKEITDAKKGQAWTKIANAIIVAVRSSGGVTDPGTNFKLRLAIEKGRSVNMPKENIEKAITRGAGNESGGAFEEVTYEGYGPAGVAIIVEAATDNKNRTAQEIKSIFERGGGTFAGKGAVSFQFSPKGYLSLSRPSNPEEAILKIMDLGVEDIEDTDDLIEIYTQPESLEEVRKGLQETGFEIKDYELTLKPNVVVPLTSVDVASKVLNLVQSLEDQNDVQKVVANFDIPREILAQLEG